MPGAWNIELEESLTPGPFQSDMGSTSTLGVRWNCAGVGLQKLPRK